MALNITQSKPKMMINLMPLLMLGGAPSEVLSHSPASASYNGKEIQFEFFGEEIHIGPIKDINYFLDNVMKEEKSAKDLCASVVGALKEHLKANGLSLTVPAHDAGGQVQYVNNLKPQSGSPVKRKSVDDPEICLYDYVPGTSESNYRAVGRSQTFMVSAKLSTEKSGSIRVEFLPGHDMDGIAGEVFQNFGLSFKNGVNSEGKHCVYASLHGSLGADDIANMFDLLGAILSRFNLQMPAGVTLGDLQP